MLGSIYIALSGMNAYSQGLQIISNNVANLDTLGYKAETINFSDVYDPGSEGLTYLGSQANAGGGEGVKVDAPQTDFSGGTLEQTGNALDLAMQGSGFLVLQSNGQTFYTRTGSFSVDQNGYITLQNTPKGADYHLAVLNASNQATPVNVNADAVSPPAATTTITLDQNLSAAATSATVSNITVYDSLGAAHTWTVDLAPAATQPTNGETSWNVTVTDEGGASIGTGTISFNNGVIDPTASKVTITDPVSGGAQPLSVTLDFSSVSSFNAGSTSTIQASNVDGNASGSLSSVTVDTNGNVLLSYSNGLTKSLGAVAIANFQNPQVLTNLGGGLYSNNTNARSTLLASGASGGSVISQQLETSNVNLTQEFGDLILIQRGYQASSEVVSVSNDMIQQLFGIRGQGG